MATVEDKWVMIQLENISKTTLEHGSKNPFDHFLKSAPDPSELLPSSNLTPQEEVRVWRKIDIRLMPILALIYLFTFLDRGNIGLATLQGLAEQLKLTGDKYNVALTLFLIPYCLFEFPSNLVLKKFRPSRWLPAITALWGVITLSMGFVKTYPQLVGVRICLGAAGAGIFPGIIYYLTLWYPRHKLQYRMGLFIGAGVMSGAFSGLLSYGISFMDGNAGMMGWSWIFIIEGCATVAVGILASFVMVDFPSTAKFLTLGEKDFVSYSKQFDTSTVGEEEQFEFRHIIMAVTDWQLWLHLLLFWPVVGPSYGIGFFLPSVAQEFGYSIAITSLLTVPPYLVALVCLLISAHFSDKLRMRWPFILVGYVYSAVGYSINISNASAGVKYFGVFLCVAGTWSTIPGAIAWFSGNVAGEYKRAAALALYIGMGNIAGIIASNTYRIRDSPRYLLGHGVQLGFMGVGFMALLTLVLTYNRINARRDSIMKKAKVSGVKPYTDEQLRRMGDKAPSFHYAI